MVVGNSTQSQLQRTKDIEHIKEKIMDELIKKVSEKTGISEDQARTAVTTVLGFLKDKLPAPIGGQIDNLMAGGASGEGGGIGDIASKVGGLLG